MSFLRSTRGFTLIELVMVIIILGILAAIAVPKFQDMQGKAHEASVAGVVGGVQAGVAIYQSQALVGNAPGGTPHGSMKYPQDLDGQADNATASLFQYVLSQSVNNDWTKDGAALTADGTVDYVYLEGETNTATCTYSNTTGGFTKN